MVSWVVEQCGQLHMLYISLVIYGFTLHLTNNTGVEKKTLVKTHKHMHTDVNVFIGSSVW